MTMARKVVVDAGVSGVYHCISRCVRRAFLCGFDAYSGRDYEHRRGWIRDRVCELSGVFGVEVLAYAVMANHLHLVVRTVPDEVRGWSAREVGERWFRLFPVGRDEQGRALEVDERTLDAFCSDGDRVASCRERLGSLSWFMRCVNEPIARRANREDGCTGRFWEGRFKCQRLVDEGAVLACMAYVDLNPVRAGLVDRPELAEFTSVYDRVVARQGAERLESARRVCAGVAKPTVRQRELLAEAERDAGRAAWLRGFGEGGSEPFFGGVDRDRYLSLLDWTGRSLRAEKRGSIPDELAPMLARLELDTEAWVSNVERFGSLFHRVAGRMEALLSEAQRCGQRWFQGRRGSGCLFRAAEAG